MQWVAGKPSPTHQNIACWICHANQNGTWHALCSFSFQKIYFKCLPCALFWKLTFQMHQGKLREGSITNKDVAIQSFNKSFREDWKRQLLQLAPVGSLNLLLLLLLWSLFNKNSISRSLAGEVLASCHNVIFTDYSLQAMDILWIRNNNWFCFKSCLY